MKLIRRSDLTAQPWKNGGGLTWEIAAFPAGAGFDDMLWRISMAEVATEGGFSAFTGIDRTLTVLSGTGLHLDFAQEGSVALDNRTPPFSFPGEAALHARLSAGPVLDFNVMTRRGVCTHQVVMLAAGQPVPNCAVALVTRHQPVKIGDLVLHPDEIIVSDQNHDLSGQVASGPVIAVIVRHLT